jgi:hypothetical protein
MLLIAGIAVIITIGVFQYLKNKKENRAIDRHNRRIEKQDELIEMLQNKKDITNEQ